VGGIGFTEMLLLAVIALIVVGPQKLPKIARTVGQLTRQARNAWQNLQSELQSELDAEHNKKIMDSTREMMEKATGVFSTDLEQDSNPDSSGSTATAADREADKAKPVNAAVKADDAEDDDRANDDDRQS
jgi:Tat protein translocase TatB subunit